MKVFWRIYTLVDLLAIVLIIATGFGDSLFGKILLAVFAGMSVSGLLKVLGKVDGEE